MEIEDIIVYINVGGVNLDPKIRIPKQPKDREISDNKRMLKSEVLEIIGQPYSAIDTQILLIPAEIYKLIDKRCQGPHWLFRDEESRRWGMWKGSFYCVDDKRLKIPTGTLTFINFEEELPALIRFAKPDPKGRQWRGNKYHNFLQRAYHYNKMLMANDLQIEEFTWIKKDDYLDMIMTPDGFSSLEVFEVPIGSILIKDGVEYIKSGDEMVKKVGTEDTINLRVAGGIGWKIKEGT